MIVYRPARLLLVAYSYPPLREVAGHRARGFARHLPEFGWTPVVLTHAPEPEMADLSIDDGSAEGVEILRTAPGEVAWRLQQCLGPRFAALRSRGRAEPAAGDRAVQRHEESRLRWFARTYLYIPDGRIAWYRDAVTLGLDAARRGPFDAVFSSFSPATAHLVAHTLSSRLGIPWIADYRDSWTADPLTPYPTNMRRRLDKFLERRLLRRCAGVTVAFGQLADELRQSTSDRVPIRVVRNGIDPSKFENVQRVKRDIWTLTHVGQFYGLFRDPTPLFRTLRAMIDGGRLSAHQLQVRLVGPRENVIVELSQRFRLEEVVHFTGPVSHQEALTEEVSADALLLLLSQQSNGLGIVPGKLSEYLGAGRPILAIVPSESETARIIEEVGAGIVAPPSSDEGIEKALNTMMSSPPEQTPRRNLSSLGRREATRQLATLLDEITGRASPA